MQAIRTKFYGPGNTRGARVQAKCEARTVYVPWDYELGIEGNHKAACEALLRRMQWHAPHGQYSPMIGGQFGAARYWVFADDMRAAVQS